MGRNISAAGAFQQGVFQGGVDLITMSQSRCNTFAYLVWLWRVPQAFCSNYFPLVAVPADPASGREGISEESADWLAANIIDADLPKGQQCFFFFVRAGGHAGVIRKSRRIGEALRCRDFVAAALGASAARLVVFGASVARQDTPLRIQNSNWWLQRPCCAGARRARVGPGSGAPT